MPFTAEHKDHFNGANYVGGENYVMENPDAEMPMRADISMEDRAAHKPVVQD